MLSSQYLFAPSKVILVELSNKGETVAMMGPFFIWKNKQVKMIGCGQKNACKAKVDYKLFIKALIMRVELWFDF